jgi:uncharacterized membrane protein
MPKQLFQPGNKMAAGHKKMSKEFREELEKATFEALKTLREIVKSGKNDKVRVQAAQVLMDRCYGRPGQSLRIDQNKPLDSGALMQALADTARGVIVNTNDAGEQQVIITPAKTLPDHNIVDITPKDNN